MADELDAAEYRLTRMNYLNTAADYIINKNQHLFKIKQESFKWDYRFLRLAKEVACWSKDPSTKVGAIVANGKEFVSLGFNGFAKGVTDDKRYKDRDTKLKLVIHAEENAVLYADRKDLKGATLYTYPFMPCSRCAAKMIQVGIKRVVSIESNVERWQEDFRLSKSQFKEAGVELVLLSEEESSRLESPYCDECGSCGESCCSPDRCRDVKNRVCEMNLKSYKELEEENEVLRKKLENSIQKDVVKYNVVNPQMKNQIDTCGGSPY